MSMCKLHSEFYRQQAKLDALLTRRCHTITEGKNGEGATYIKTARGWLHIAHGVRNTAEGLRYVIYLFVTDLKEPWKVIAEPAGFLIAPRGWERVSDVSNVVFTNGAIADDDGKVYIYYAASDTRLHVASTTIGQLLDFAFKNPADPLRSRDCVAQRVALIEKKSGISQSARPVISCARGPAGASTLAQPGCPCWRCWLCWCWMSASARSSRCRGAGCCAVRLAFAWISPPTRKLWTASGSALNGRGKPRPRLILQGLEKTAAYQDEAGKRYTGFMLQTLGLPLSGDYGQVPAKLWYLHKV